MDICSPSLYIIHRDDNVATAVSEIDRGPALTAGIRSCLLEVTEPITRGFKIALCDIPKGLPVIKYGVAIAYATRDIRQGECVHIHNAASYCDARSSTCFDKETSAPSDMKYSFKDQEGFDD